MNTPAMLWPRLATLLLSALAAASVAFWGLKLTGPDPSPVSAPVASVQDATPPVDPGAIARFLGGGAVQTAAPVASLASRFVLTGIVATSNQAGAALIAVDGKPAKPYRVGASLEGGLVVQAVMPRKAVLGAGMGGPPTFTLELPALPGSSGTAALPVLPGAARALTENPSAAQAQMAAQFNAAKTSGTPGFAFPRQTGNPTQ